MVVGGLNRRAQGLDQTGCAILSCQVAVVHVITTAGRDGRSAGMTGRNPDKDRET